MTTPPSPGGPAYSYVALGDSYASGEALSPFASGSDTSADKCHRSLRSYPFLIYAEVALGRFHDYACSGATTDRISTSTQGASATHGAGGPLRILTQYEPAPLHQAFVEAARQAGIPFNPDYNAGDPTGISYTS